MTTLSLQYDILNDTPANAGPVEANFNKIEQFINQELVNRDGSIPMTGPLRLPGDPINQLEAATKGYVDRSFPVGALMLYAGGAAPAGGTWMLCNGAALDPVTYPQLFGVIGNSYGTSGGLFLLPDLRSRVPIGAGAGLTVGAVGGSADAVTVAHTHLMDHTHPTATSASADAAHAHTIPAHTHTITHGHTGSADPGGSDHTHTVATKDNPAAGGSSGEPMISNAGGTASTRTTVAGGGAHSHILNITQHVGNASIQDAFSTTSAGGPHNHTVAVPALTGVASGSTGVVPTGTNLPPYQVINYVIKVR